MDFRVFNDETGVHDDAPVTAVAGYFAHAKTWKKFDRRWGNPPSMHLVSNIST
jgi:hypothetical protein